MAGRSSGRACAGRHPLDSWRGPTRSADQSRHVCRGRVGVDRGWSHRIDSGSRLGTDCRLRGRTGHRRCHRVDNDPTLLAGAICPSAADRVPRLVDAGGSARHMDGTRGDAPRNLAAAGAVPTATRLAISSSHKVDAGCGGIAIELRCSLRFSRIRLILRLADHPNLVLRVAAGRFFSKTNCEFFEDVARHAFVSHHHVSRSRQFFRTDSTEIHP